MTFASFELESPSFIPRLKICVHPCLLAEYADPFIAPEEMDEETKKEEKAVVVSEIGRARALVGEAFVVKMKEKLKQEALQRMEAEKKVYSAQPREISLADFHYLRARTLLLMTNAPLFDIFYRSS